MTSLTRQMLNLIDARAIDSEALTIIKQLQDGGFVAYLVGGCVRDLLLGLQPKDFDIVTSAKPKTVRFLVKNSYLIGKRFKLVLVKRGVKQFEVATFRKAPENSTDLSTNDNVFGGAEDDASRRDLTINSIFYDPIAKKIEDYEDGVKDINKRIIRMIGDPYVRLKEDPIRILRILRFAEKLKFSIEPELKNAITKLGSEIKNAKLPRIREEIIKILKLANPKSVFLELLDLDILKYISPTLHTAMQNKSSLEDFTVYLDNINVCDETDPKERFAYLTLGFLTAFKSYDPESKIERGSIINDATLQTL